MTTSVTATSLGTRFPAVTVEPDPRTLAGEHAVLLRDVQRRVTPVVALLDAHGWPAAELHTLVTYLRSEVLRQASDEEVLLFPSGASAPIAELTADHVRLRTLTDELSQVAGTAGPSPALKDLLADLLAVLQRHLLEEQAVLAALPDVPTDVPSAAALSTGAQSWPSGADAGSVVIVLDALPPEQAVELGIERLLRLRPGQTAEVRAREPDILVRVRQWMQGFDSVGYGIDHVAAGRLRPALLVTRRSPS